MHLTIILDKLTALKALHDRTHAAVNKAEQKIHGNQLTQAQIATLDTQFDNVGNCLGYMEDEFPEMDEALDIIEPIVEGGLLG